MNRLASILYKNRKSEAAYVIQCFRQKGKDAETLSRLDSDITRFTIRAMYSEIEEREKVIGILKSYRPLWAKGSKYA